MFLSKTDGLTIFDETNYASLVRAIDDSTMHGGYVGRDWSADPYGGQQTAFESFRSVSIIPRSEWADRLEYKEKTQSRLVDIHRHYKLPILDQNGNGYCWCFGTVGAIMVARATMGLPTRHLSAASLAAQIKNGRNEGGWASEALRGLPKYGIYEHAYWPEQSRALRDPPEELKLNALKYSVPIAVDLPKHDFDALASCLLYGYPVTMGLLWWGHLIYGLDLIRTGRDEWGILIANSWTRNWEQNGMAILRESKCQADEQIAIIGVSTY